jgi:hypothetical protein
VVEVAVEVACWIYGQGRLVVEAEEVVGVYWQIHQQMHRMLLSREEVVVVAFDVAVCLGVTEADVERFRVLQKVLALAVDALIFVVQPTFVPPVIHAVLVAHDEADPHPHYLLVPCPS